MLEEYQIPDRIVPNIGDTIDNYKIQKELGHGSFGNVYKVIDNCSKNILALKLLKLWEITYPEIRQGIIQRFKLEYETGQIKSEYLVHTKGFGKIKGNPYILMEFCSNGDLKTHMKCRGNIDFVTKVAQEVLLGLKALHSNGKIHRDLKPENVLLDSNNIAKLSDFGIAGHKNIRMTKRDIFGKPKEIFGTYAYMPPEQIQPQNNHVTVLPTCDIFSFAVMMYELFTLQYPFGKLENHADLTEYIKNAKMGSYSQINKIRKDVPKFWTDIIEKCLQPDYRKRYQNVEEILEKIGKPSPTPIIQYNTSRNQIALQIMQGEQYEKKYNLTELLNEEDEGALTIGRDDAENNIFNNINIVEVPFDNKSYYISRKHATIEKIAGLGWYIKDGQWCKEERRWKLSTNGTYVNSLQVLEGEHVKINPGDIITIGDTTLKVIVI